MNNARAAQRHLMHAQEEVSMAIDFTLTPAQCKLQLEARKFANELPAVCGVAIGSRICSDNARTNRMWLVGGWHDQQDL